MNTAKLIQRLASNSRYVYGCQQNIRRASPVAGRMSTSASTARAAQDKAEFQEVLPDIIHSLVTDPRFTDLPEVGKWMQEVLEYNLEGGKKTRGLTVVRAYEMLCEPCEPRAVRQARVLGWCVEMLQAYFLMVDDMMDGAVSRRGRACWYRVAGARAHNDAVLVHAALHRALHHHLHAHRAYAQLLHLFSDTVLTTSVGQHLDHSTSSARELAAYTPALYAAIVRHKTAAYTFALPLSLALALAGRLEPAAAAAVTALADTLGHLFQIQDDYIDCFGSEAETGKAGTDIQEGKCSWLCVAALQRCSAAQRAALAAHYGSHEPRDVHAVKALYRELGLPALYRAEEARLHRRVLALADRSPPLPPALVRHLARLTYRRRA